MSLIFCPECNKEISDKATSCPQCAYPLTQKHEATSVQTIEKTSKKYKLYLVLSIIGILFSGFGCVIKISSKDADTGYWPLSLFVFLIWFLITKALIWWNHK